MEELEKKSKGIKHWLRHFGMPEENIDNCITQIAQDYGACRFLEGVSLGAEAVVEQMNISKTNYKRYIDKPILDACCGGKMFYYDKNDSRVLFMDKRCIETQLKDRGKLRHFEVKPDVVGDFTKMEFADETFRLVVFDPPHLKYTGSKKEANGWQMTKYGWLPAHSWKDMLTKGFSECFRVLEPGGILIFKWNETDITLNKILELTPHKPVFGHISGKRANTHWVCFMKEI